MKTKITPDVYLFIFLGLAFVLHFLIPLTQLISYPYSLPGAALVLSGILISFRSNFILLKHSTSLKPFEGARVLITSGPFRWSRNPIYLGMALILLGTVILLGSLISFACPLLFFLIINGLVIPSEEALLEKAFGEDYRLYKTKVRRWI